MRSHPALAQFFAKLPYAGLAVFIGWYALPLPAGITIAPLLVSAFALSLPRVESEASVPPAPDTYKLGLIIAFAASYVSSILLSEAPLASLQATSLFLPGLLAGFLTYKVIEQEAATRALLRGSAICAGLSSALYLYAYTQSPGTPPGEVLERLGSLALVVPNDLVLYVILMPFLVLGLLREDNSLARYLYYLAILLTVVALGLSGSRLIAIVSALLILLLLGMNRRERVLIPFALLLGALILAAVDNTLHLGLLNKAANILQHNGRLSVWYAGLTEWTTAPITGAGPGQFESLYRRALSAETIPTWMLIDSRMVTWAHSMAIEALAERGLLGLLVMAVLTADMMRCFIGRTSGEKLDFHRAILVSFSLYLVAGILELTLQRNWVVVLFCMYLAIYLKPAIQLAERNS